MGEIDPDPEESRKEKSKAQRTPEEVRNKIR